MAKITTTKFYHAGFESAKGDNPRRSPHREGTGSDEKWLAGYNAYISGGADPEEPRKRRSKEDISMDSSTTSNFNATPRELPHALRIKQTNFDVASDPNVKRKPHLMDQLFELKDQIKEETDSEMLELLEMDLADVEWLAGACQGVKPSDDWDSFKSE